MQADKKLNIVIWAFPSWQGDYMKSTVELAKELALHHRVLYIDYAYTLKDVLAAKANSTIPVKRIMNAKFSLKNIKLENDGQITVLSLPPVLPFNWTNSETIYSLIEGLNNSIVSKRIAGALKQLDFKADIVINAFNPFFGNAIPQIFPSCPVIYYCYDNIAASAWASKHGGRLEQEFATKVNAAIFSSEALKENKAWKIPAYVVKNGVDIRMFNKISGEQAIDVSTIKQNSIIGYVGTVDDRLDFEMLEKIALANPHLEFNFIGRVITEKGEQLKSLPNVKYFGAVDPQRLPAMMQHFEAAIIPFVKNDFTKNVYPMKVNEYLAMGIPVVSTGFARFSDLAGYMEIAEDAASFSLKLNEVISNNNNQKKEDRKAKARANSWEQKSMEFENILMHYAG